MSQERVYGCRESNLRQKCPRCTGEPLERFAYEAHCSNIHKEIVCSTGLPIKWSYSMEKKPVKIVQYLKTGGVHYVGAVHGILATTSPRPVSAPIVYFGDFITPVEAPTEDTHLEVSLWFNPQYDSPNVDCPIVFRMLDDRGKIIAKKQIVLSPNNIWTQRYGPLRKKKSVVLIDMQTDFTYE